MKKVKEVILVEGKYDKNTLSQTVDATIVETAGFGVFSDREKIKLIRRLGEKHGLIVLTDSDGAGFLIRNHLRGMLSGIPVKNAYIPDVPGKERRKCAPSREGKLGVEGMRPEVLLEALKTAGATFEEEEAEFRSAEITKTDLYRLGLSGGKNSAEKRKMLMKRLNLPERLTANALLQVLNALYSREEFLRICENLTEKR